MAVRNLGSSQSDPSHLVLLGQGKQLVALNECRGVVILHLHQGTAVKKLTLPNLKVKKILYQQ